MAIVNPAPFPLDLELITLYFAKDPLIGNLPVVIFHGPSTTTNSTHNSSRIQAHVFSIAGYVSFPRLTISPTSPLYAAVHQLPEEKQGDETCRGLAVSLLKYFSEMPAATKQCLKDLVAIGRTDEKAPPMFDRMHAANLAAKMTRVENAYEIASHIFTALADKRLSWADIDVILPARSISRTHRQDPFAESEEKVDVVDDGRPLIDYGSFTGVVNCFGSPYFLPTSKLRRAPSRPTAVSRTRTIAQGQMESLHREMKEILETEKNYVLKIYDLTKSVAVEHSRKAYTESHLGVPPSETAMFRLFPPSLTQILDINTEFLEAMRHLMGDNDENSIHPADAPMPWITERDPTGSDSFARVLLRFFPRFKGPYQEYIKASAHFPKLLSEFLRDSDSSFAQALRQTGEQRLRSWLIEPVQRLPRYSLFIDNMVSQLPATHPAMMKFLKARDIVTDTCALDNDESGDNSLAIKRLKTLVMKWPDSLLPEGRLITAVDAAEISAPYRVTPGGKEASQIILLLFPDYVLVLRKLEGNTFSARGLLAELDRPASAPSTVAVTSQQSVSFSSDFRLQESRFTESNGGCVVSLTNIRKAFETNHVSNSGTNYTTTTRSYQLLGSYEGKAARWSEEVARARIEYRFPEKMREDEKWGLRIASPQNDDLGIVAAIFEDDSTVDTEFQRRLHGKIRVSVSRDLDPDQGQSQKNDGVEITSQIAILDPGRYRIDFQGFNDFTSTDYVSVDDFEAVFMRRLGNLQRMHHQPVTLEMAQSQISYTQKIIETIRPRFPLLPSQSRGRLRPISMSPVKALTNFLGGSIRDAGSPTKQRPVVGDLFGNEQPSPLPLQQTSHARSKSQLSRHNEDTAKSKVTLVVAAPDAPETGSLSQLETTFGTYIVALHSRCGNVVGKILRGRAGADELKVNELYNTLIEDPNKHQAAAEVPVDVLFAAFEKFLAREWKERMGVVVSRSLLKQMQSIFDTMLPNRIPEQFRNCLDQMTPQNRRAFSAMIRLLCDLLDASGNDGDRGALTAAFAEALVVDENPHSYIALLDRLVDDIDTFFDDGMPVEVTTAGLPSGFLQRARSINTGSISSNGSSLRKRFGLGILTRENSKSEPESKVGQVWRTLSKKRSGDDDSQPSSLSKSFLARSRSTDNDTRKPLPPRPGSQDRPNSSNSIQQEPRSRPGSAHNTVSSLLSIGEHTPAATASLPRKKRRSSLSDLKELQNIGATSFGETTPIKVNPPESSIAPFQTARNVLRTPSPSKFQKPPPASISRNTSPSRKENVAPKLVSPQAPTGIPSLSSALKERSSPSNIPTLSAKRPGASPQKLKIQSPQKLRERLDKEKRAMQEAGPGLQEELAKMGNDLAAISISHDGYSSVNTLSARITKLEEKMSTNLEELAKRAALTRNDVESSLVVVEKKCKSLDELYREANAENELLYERFNSELGKVLGRVKRGEGIEAMQAKLQEAQDDATRLRKENQRLKRENLGLRSQLSG